MANITNATDITSRSTLPASIDIFFSALNIFLSITASLGNALILTALYKVSSIYPPTKWLLGCLAVTDLCVGLISQPLYAIYLLTSYDNMENFLTYLQVANFFSSMLFLVSILTSAAISVDRLLALLLRMRYRHVVTLRRVRVVIGCVWLFAVLNAALWTAAWIRFLHITFSLFWLFVSLIISAIVISTFSYIKIIFTIRHQQAQLQDHVQLGQLNGGGDPLNIARYKKTVWSIAWVQLTLLICYAPYAVVQLTLRFANIENSTVASGTIKVVVCLLYLNSSLNPIVYCWRIRDVREEVKDILRKCAPS